MDETEDSCLIEDNWSISIDNNVPTTDEIAIIMDLLKKCRILATFTKKSYKIANFIHKNQILLKLNKTLNNDCESRWNSTYVLIDSLLQMKPLLVKLFGEKRNLNLKRDQIEKLTLVELNNDDWEFLSCLHHVLKPFYLATVMMSGKNYPSIGLAYYAVQRIKQFCSNDNISNNHIKELKKLLLKKLYTYFFDDLEQYQYFQVKYKVTY